MPPCLGHFYKEARQFVRGSMQYLYDSEGASTSTASQAYRS